MIPARMGSIRVPKKNIRLLAGKPLNELVTRYGPFITNTEGEMKQAMLDYQNGKMGKL